LIFVFEDERQLRRQYAEVIALLREVLEEVKKLTRREPRATHYPQPVSATITVKGT